MWLLREAFDVTPDETVSIRFSAVAGTRTPRSASIAIVAVAGALVMGFVVAPLRPRAVLRQQREGSTEPELTAAVRERELVYAMIRDLDDDFETGKVGAADRDRLRAELRARAIELLRSERAAAQTPAETLAEPSGEGDETTSDRFCPSCGERAAATWRFCSRCGGALPAAPLAASVGPEPEPRA